MLKERAASEVEPHVCIQTLTRRMFAENMNVSKAKQDHEGKSMLERSVLSYNELRPLGLSEGDRWIVKNMCN